MFICLPLTTSQLHQPGGPQNHTQALEARHCARAFHSPSPVLKIRVVRLSPRRGTQDSEDTLLSCDGERAECGWAFRVHSAQLTHAPLLTPGAALKTSNREFYRTLTSKYMQKKGIL